MFNIKKYQKDKKEKLKRYRKRHYQKNRKKILKQIKKYKAEHKEKIKEDSKRYYKKNKKRIRKKAKIYRKKKKVQERVTQARWYEKNKRRLLKKAKEYRQNNKEKIRSLRRKRRARMKNIIHDFSTKEWIEKLKDTNGVCPKCKRFVGVENLTLDHIHPVSKAKEGQIYTIDDVQPLCIKCNIRKSDKIE